MPHAIDALIVGQGLAGATLAWRLAERGATFAIVAADRGPTASRVAAGLLAPVGGKRLALAWRAEQTWPCALKFYQAVGKRLARELLSEEPFVRLFVDDQQQREFENRRRGPLAEFILSTETDLQRKAFHQVLRGFQTRGARLDVSAYLEQSRRVWEDEGVFFSNNIDANEDLEFHRRTIAVRPLGLHAKHVILCRGWGEAGQSDRLKLPFEPTKGEVLTLRVPGLSEPRVVQRRVWLAPEGGGLYKAGATFDRDRIEASPTREGRVEIIEKLRGFLRLPYEVVDHQAGVRPILQSRRPLAGPVPGRERIAVLNGLGANGTLWAPWVADQLARWILDGVALPEDIDPRERLGR